MILRMLIVLFPILCASLAAQPSLELRLLKPNSPHYYYYQLYFAAYCDGEPIYDLSKHQLLLKEREHAVDTTTYMLDRQPSPTRNNCYDIALLFDNSSTVTTSTLAHVTEAANVFIDSMTLECQNAGIISFADRPTVHAFLGTDRSTLKEALTEMNAGGRRALYDAIFTAMIDINTNARAAQRLIFAMTTGRDNGSSRNVSQLLQSARYYDVRIFILAFGEFEAADLRRLCMESGGRYDVISDTDMLVPYYEAFESYVQREYDEYRLVRRTNDAIQKNLRIDLRLEACDDSVWTSRMFNVDEVVIGVHTLPSPHAVAPGTVHPNPVTSSDVAAAIGFSLDGVSSVVSVYLYDALGRHIRSLQEAVLAPGRHTVRFSPRGLAPGTYFYRVYSERITHVGKFLVIH